VGKTIIEKIFQNHSENEVKPGEIIWLNLDARTARDFAGANVVKNYEREYNDEPVDDPARTFFTFDCNVPANTIAYANNQHICRLFARKHGIKVYDVNMGIGSHVAIEKGLVAPSETFVGTDSHLNILGAISAFGQGMGDVDIAFAFKAGKTWFEVPKTMRIQIKGKYNFPVSAKDLTLYLVGKLGSKGALGYAVEYYGEVIENLSFDERITLASMATEMGAIISFIPVNDNIVEFCKKRTNREFKVCYADTDADYDKELTFDIGDLAAMIAKPGHPDNVVEVKEVAGRKIDSVLIGSCTNGRIEDIKAVLEVLKDRKIHENVMAKIVPATREVYTWMVNSGALKKLHDAGFIISMPGCGGCAQGQLGMTGKGEVQISTSNRNFTGKQGHGDTYLASPAVATASAITGEITDPANLI